MAQAEMKAEMKLEDFDMSEERGFLARFDADRVDLPGELAPAREAAMALPRLILTGAVRKHLEALPQIDVTDFCQGGDNAAQRVALVHYSFMVQAYVWGEGTPPKTLPATLAVPTWELSKAVGQKPLLSYANYVLDNWAKIDAGGPIDLSNVHMIQPFIAGQDEAWFVMVHVAIEARAGEMLVWFPALMAAAGTGDEQTVETGLSAMSAAWDDINAIFDRMPERCDPYIYFNRVRPWIHGWKDNPAMGEGLIYEGVEEAGGRPQAFRGQTGSQSSIVPAMDALLGIGHADDPLRTYLNELHDYRPPAHRAFIDHVRGASTLRAFLQAKGNAALSDLYNDCVMKLARFRTRHLEYAASYINKQAGGGAGNDTEVGTGGTPFMKYLKKHRDEARAQLLKV